jgi:hypothetical protein
VRLRNANKDLERECERKDQLEDVCPDGFYRNNLGDLDGSGYRAMMGMCEDSNES